MLYLEHILLSDQLFIQFQLLIRLRAIPSMVIAERPRWQLNMATYSHYGNSQFQGQQWLPCMWVGHKIEVSAAALLATEITGDASMLKDKSAVARQDDIIISG